MPDRPAPECYKLKERSRRRPYPSLTRHQRQPGLFNPCGWLSLSTLSSLVRPSALWRPAILLPGLPLATGIRLLRRVAEEFLVSINCEAPPIALPDRGCLLARLLAGRPGAPRPALLANDDA